MAVELSTNLDFSLIAIINESCGVLYGEHKFLRIPY
jgi:hypothetical protein